MDADSLASPITAKLVDLSLANGNHKQEEHGHAPTVLKVTPTQVWGPFYVAGAPYRAKLSPIWAKGQPIVIKGVVYGLDTGKPLPFASIDLWQTSPDSEYDYYEPDGQKHAYKNEMNTHGKAKEFNFRARMVTDDYGRFEYETVKPSPYFDPDDSTWRTSHIHYFVQHPGYKPLVTQMYFDGEEKNKIDRHIKDALIITLEEVVHEDKEGEKFKYYKANFDLTLEPEDTRK